MAASGGPRPAPGTLNHLFFEAVAKYDKLAALMVKRRPDGEYQNISHRQLADRVRHVALALGAAGFSRGDRIGILSGNCPEWAVCDYAFLTGGFVTVPVYPSLPADQIVHILRDSGCTAVFASDSAQVAKVAQVRSQLPALKLVVTFADAAEAADDTLSGIEAKGARLDSPERASAYKARALECKPDDLATIIYTSGTTGNPKGVMLTHDNLHSNVRASADVLPFDNDTSLSLLPLSHSFERTAGHFLMFAVGATIAYAESVDTVARNMGEVHPTFVISVPRLYEKLYARILENARAGGALKLAIFNWARDVSDRWATVRLAGGTPRGLLALQYSVANKLVFSKLRERTGGKLRFFVSGGAPLSPELNKFFFAAGLTILEGYGLTETSPVLTVNTPKSFRIGTVGKPIAGIDLMIAGDGEILARGPGIMAGYYNNPAATSEVIDKEGWFHTGDIGVLQDGFLSITDRKKDIIVTAGGKNIAPQAIESKVRNSEFVSEAVMIGDKRKFPSMVIVPDFGRLERWMAQQAGGRTYATRAELISAPEVVKKMEEEVLGRLQGLASFETPKKIALLEHEFSIDKGELTPSMKVKRRVIDANYKDVIDAMYVDATAE